MHWRFFDRSSSQLSFASALKVALIFALAAQVALNLRFARKLFFAAQMLLRLSVCVCLHLFASVSIASLPNKNTRTNASFSKAPISRKELSSSAEGRKMRARVSRNAENETILHSRKPLKTNKQNRELTDFVASIRRANSACCLLSARAKDKEEPLCRAPESCSRLAHSDARVSLKITRRVLTRAR